MSYSLQETATYTFSQKDIGNEIMKNTPLVIISYNLYNTEYIQTWNWLSTKNTCRSLVLAVNVEIHL